MNELLERILPAVQKPARYVGGEYNQIVKDKKDVELRVAFCFPDTYEIGMSNVGMRILYAIMNNMDGVWCERVFTPWGDMEQEMRRHNLPLYGLESHDPMEDFDLIAFSVGYEMSYTNILTMLDLGNIPLHAKDRTGLKHIVFAGGACTYNPEPLADFVDFFSLGEGEESTVEILECYRDADCSPPRRAKDGDKAYRPGSGQGVLSHQDDRPIHGDRPRPDEFGGHARLHPRMPVLPGGLYLPACAAKTAGHPVLPGEGVFGGLGKP